MAKGVTDSFADGIARLLGELGKMRAYPDADDQLLDGIQDMLVQRVRQAFAAPQGMPQGGPGQNPLAAMLQGGMPVQEAEMSRGPIPGMETGEAAAALERQMAGQAPTG